MIEDKIFYAINLLEHTDLQYSIISEKTGLSIKSIENINRCKSYTKYHNYKNNIREENGKKQFYDKGELNPRAKLTENVVIEIIELL